MANQADEKRSHLGTLPAGPNGTMCTDSACWCFDPTQNPWPGDVNNEPEEEAPDALYNAVNQLARIYGTVAIRGICDALEAEARENG